MGKISVITQKQKLILEGIAENGYLRSQFYFTGGTVLAEYYLQHRYSEDLDFFSEEKFDNQIIFTIISGWKKKYNFDFKSRFVEVVYRFELIFTDKTKIKLDFGYYPYKRLEKSLKKNNIQIDSLRDIATNKLFTINQRTDVKDFADLYFLLKDKFTVWDLIDSTKVKFGEIYSDIELIALDMMKVDDFTEMPKMIKPLKLDQLKRYFRERAVQIGRRAVK